MQQERLGLNIRQEAIFRFIKGYLNKHGYSPTLREIAERAGLKSHKNVLRHLNTLQEYGYIKRSLNLSRAIEVVSQQSEKAMAGFKLPIVGTVQAGAFMLAEENIDGYMTIDEGLIPHSEGAFILKIKGDSMIEAGINEGDMAVVVPDKNVADNDIVIALSDGEATIKRFFRKKDKIILKPENKTMKLIEIHAKDERDFSILGKVMHVIKSF